MKFHMRLLVSQELFPILLQLSRGHVHWQNFYFSLEKNVFVKAEFENYTLQS